MKASEGKENGADGIGNTEKPFDTVDTSEDQLRRRLRFRAWHRGTREMDLMLGRFADAHLENMPDVQLRSFAKLLEENDPDLYDWMTGRGDFPSDTDPDLAQILRKFHV